MRTDDFTFDLPAALIAQMPVEPRDAARLMVVHRQSGTIEHRHFRDISDYLHPHDLLVMNDTRVLRARLRGRLSDSGGAVEALLLRDLGDGCWETLVRPGRRLQPGRGVTFAGGDATVDATVVEVLAGGERVLRFPAGVDPDRFGETPLPPYITQSVTDGERYQTVYAREPGSAAAPTAGLHFTPELLDRLQRAGVERTTVTLHIGPGTFRPVQVDDPREHPMHSEFYRLPPATITAIERVRRAGGRIVATGTTSVRVLEQAGQDAERGDGLTAAEGWTDILILPGYRFRLIDALITNFHLPRSTLLMLVSALAGRDLILRAYREAVDHGYRFYSFGDAMLIL